MDTLKYIKNKFQLRFLQEMPIKVPIDRDKGLTSLFAELEFKAGAEIGVLKGLYSKWLCAKNKKLKLYCVDAWTSYKEYCEDEDQKMMDSCFKKAQERLVKFNCVFIRKFSMDAVEDFKDNSLDFVYIDANHAFQYVVNDIAEWSKKVRLGGIVAGDDYSDCLFEVKTAVDAWMKANRIKPWFITKEDRHTSWFYVKQKDNLLHRQS